MVCSSVLCLSESQPLIYPRETRGLIGQEVDFITSGQGIDAGKLHGKKLEGFIKQVKASIMMRPLFLKPHWVSLIQIFLTIFWRNG